MSIVNETMARTLWPGRDPIGECLFVGPTPAEAVACARIVGIVGDANFNQHDGLHPTAEGVAVVVKGILPQVEALIAQVSSPVRWEAVVGRLASEGITTYVEVGPGTVLSGLVRRVHREASVISFGSPGDLMAIETHFHV